MIDDGLVQVRCWYCDAGCEECDNTGYLRTDTETAGKPHKMMTPTIHKLEIKRRRAVKNQHNICHKGGKSNTLPRRLKYWLSVARKLNRRIIAQMKFDP